MIEQIDIDFEEKYIFEAIIVANGPTPMDMAISLYNLATKNNYIVGFNLPQSVSQTIITTEEGDKYCVNGRVSMTLLKMDEEKGETTIQYITFYQVGQDDDPSSYYVDYEGSKYTVKGAVEKPDYLCYDLDYTKSILENNELIG